MLLRGYRDTLGADLPSNNAARRVPANRTFEIELPNTMKMSSGSSPLSSGFSFPRTPVEDGSDSDEFQVNALWYPIV